MIVNKKIRFDTMVVDTSGKPQVFETLNCYFFVIPKEIKNSVKSDSLNKCYTNLKF